MHLAVFAVLLLEKLGGTGLILPNAVNSNRSTHWFGKIPPVLRVVNSRCRLRKLRKEEHHGESERPINTCTSKYKPPYRL